jgi:hypothetical protein
VKSVEFSTTLPEGPSGSGQLTIQVSGVLLYMAVEDGAIRYTLEFITAIFISILYFNIYFKPCIAKTRHFYIFMCMCWFRYHTYADNYLPVDTA